MYQRFIWIWIILLSMTGCDKFLEVPLPSTSLLSENVFQDSSTATAAVAGIYERCMENQLNVFNGGCALYAGLSADELMVTSSNPQFQEFYYHALPSNHTLVQAYWQELYQMIYQSNALIEGLKEGVEANLNWANRLTGEALFLRAVAYSELLPLFGNLPLVLTTDYRINGTLPRTDSVVLYSQLIGDLQIAAGLLPMNYPSVSGLRSRPNQAAVFALLSRIYLYQQNWQAVENMANQVLAQQDLYALASTPRAAFLPDSKEAIWHLPAVMPNYNTGQASNFVQLEGVPTYATLQPSLVESLEEGDLRKTDWIHVHSYEGVTYYQPYKYQYTDRSQGTEHMVLLRLAEVLLNRAEARLHLGDLEGALADINTIRNRAGLPLLNDASTSAVATALSREQRVELMVENGFRFKILKRTGQLDAVMKALKPNDWQINAAFFPIPDIEIKNNPAIEQNAGY